MNQRGFGLVVYLGLALAVLATLGGLAFAANRWCNGACQDARKDADGWREQAVELDAALHKQNEAINTLRQTSKRRADVAAAKLKKAEEGVAVLAAKVQSLLAEQPSVPGDPCASACTLLRQPL